MMIYLIMFVPPIVIAAALLYFRSRLRKMRRQSCKDACCDAAIGSVREVRQQLTKVIEESRAPQSEAARNGHIPIRSIVILMLILGAMLTGYELGVHSERNRTQTVGVSPIAATVSPAVPHGLIDSKLAELRARPTLAVVEWFRSIPVDSERRADVIASMRRLVQSDDWSQRNAAEMNLIRWEQ